MYEYQVLINYKVVKQGSYQECMDYMFISMNKKYAAKVWELRQVPVAVKLSADEVSLYWNGAAYNPELSIK